MQRLQIEKIAREKQLEIWVAHWQQQGFSQEEIDRFFSGAPMYVTEERGGGGDGGGGDGGGVSKPSSRNPLIIECPHCTATIMIEALNCRLVIFAHAHAQICYWLLFVSIYVIFLKMNI